MDINNINNYTRIISYNDDNHGIRIYINGNFIDDMDNGLEAAVHLLTAGQETNIKLPIVTADIYIFEIDKEDEVINKVHRLLSEADALTPEQEVALFNKKYEEI